MESAFESLDIVQYLKERCSIYYSPICELYSACDDLLQLIPITFPNYTLHDITHSIRIIKHINDLIKDQLNDYSELHLALIIYVALLHDTGMVVSKEEKEELYSFFKSQRHDFLNLSEDDRLFFLQDYIREKHGERVKNALQYEISEEKTIGSLLNIGNRSLRDISQIVINICQAHTEDSKWIRDNLLEKKVYGRETIYPRQIAVLLRIGDSLDIDDNRAPYVLYKILRPQGYSNNEWQKHNPITNYDKIEKIDDYYTITFTGESAEPDIFREVDNYIINFETQLKDDLKLCNGESALNIRLPINSHIEPIGFEKTPLIFSFDYKQISKLLMGEQIYGTKRAGLRELLQNAIDAVLLMKEIKGKEAYSNYAPLVGIIFNKKANQITVFDNGIGMTEDIMQRFFFSVGNSYYQSDDFYREGYTYNPIGHFGIGFLACFMLSSKVTLETKRYMANSDYIKMSFDKDSPYIIKYKIDQQQYSHDYGTRITLDYDQIIPDVFEDENEIQEYIENLLRYDNIDFVICSGETKKHLGLMKPNRIFKCGDEIIEYSIDLDKKAPIVHTIRELISSWNSKCTYLQNGETYINLFSLQCLFSNLHREIDYRPLNNYRHEALAKIIKAYITTNPNCQFLMQVYNDYLASEKHIIKHSDLYNLLDRSVEAFLHTDYFTCYKFNPKANTVPAKERKPNEDHNIIVICTDNDIHAEKHLYDFTNLPMIDKALSTEEPEITHYMTAYTSNRKQYVTVNKDTVQDSPTLYFRGIYVTDSKTGTVNLPYQIAGIPIQSSPKEWYNFSTGQYELNVARNSLDDESKAMIANKILCLLYIEIIQNGGYITEVKNIIRSFLNTYYKSTYEQICEGTILETKYKTYIFEKGKYQYEIEERRRKEKEEKEQATKDRQRQIMSSPKL